MALIDGTAMESVVTLVSRLEPPSSEDTPTLYVLTELLLLTTAGFRKQRKEMFLSFRFFTFNYIKAVPMG
jgi:hypothetical protein